MPSNKPTDVALPPFELRTRAALRSVIEHHGIEATEQVLAELRRTTARAKHRYVCSVCQLNPVDAESGFDTCSDCLARI